MLSCLIGWIALNYDTVIPDDFARTVPVVQAAQCMDDNCSVFAALFPVQHVLYEYSNARMRGMCGIDAAQIPPPRVTEYAL